ncbi:serine hydrolase, partial [Nonomuraea sp. 10N515B]|uniref:serine hydrolase n=1 Tax=Nonomuraea sp. 10N515B TaxID=3457422 RepID=UPI003FCEC0C2
ASLLPDLLAATRTGLPPASDDELTNRRSAAMSRLHLLFCWAHEHVSVALWNSYHLPGTDGGAHEAALQRLKPGANVTLDQLVSAMIEESDNAAADLLRDRLGPGALRKIAQTRVSNHQRRDAPCLRWLHAPRRRLPEELRQGRKAGAAHASRLCPAGCLERNRDPRRTWRSVQSARRTQWVV